MWHIYILRCKDGSLYTGFSNDVEKRLKRHNSGKASKYTRGRWPLKLIYTESFPRETEARHREVEIKKFSTENKVD